MVYVVQYSGCIVLKMTSYCILLYCTEREIVCNFSTPDILYARSTVQRSVAVSKADDGGRNWCVRIGAVFDSSF